MKATFLILALVFALPTAALAAPLQRGVCSGIGDESIEEAATIPHTLKLVYAQADGHYLGAVATRITGPGDTVVVEAMCDGPWLLVDLAPGTYKVAATFEGQTKTRTVTVGKSASQQVFTF